MAASSSGTSGPPSSSAVTIPVPGKSILKKPPPQHASLFSRITRFLPTTQSPSADEEERPLKRAHFILPQIATVYPISSLNPPSTPTSKDEKRAIEHQEAERRRKIVSGSPNSGVAGDEPAEWWSMDKVDAFYRECCAGCEEEPDPAVSVAFKVASTTTTTTPRTLDLSGVVLTRTSAAILSDVFTIEWGLRKLVLRECDLDEHVLKPILHSLLIPSTLSFLSLASNRKLKAPAFRLIGAYVRKATGLHFLDLSQNPLDKKSMEFIVAGLQRAPEPGLVSLRLDDCQLRPAALESLCRTVRTSSLKNISLRYNRISASGGVALALMIRDYPDLPPSTSSTSTSTSTSSLPSSPTISISSLLPLTSPPGTPSLPSPPATKVLGGSPHLAPPPRHPTTLTIRPPIPTTTTTATTTTTYTPYVPRTRRGGAGGAAPVSPLVASGHYQIPIITSSLQGGITARHPASSANANLVATTAYYDAGPSVALLDKVRALDNLPRLGALKTLDLKGNDLRNGIAYLAQVLKRNRTLKVLNLSENKLDVQCLVIIAEALKYNSCLETLDLNKNPCSGPGLEGIQSLRTAFTLNTALKRLFLSSTSMTSIGAIALAEFLPESSSLLHLDLTTNNIDIAGVMALSSGLKANHTMRCLDLNIPPGDEAFARMCREILNTCVRNTEEAARTVKAGDGGGGGGRKGGKGVWGMIEDSELAKSIRLDEEKKTEKDIVVRARSCIKQLSAISDSSSFPATQPRTAANDDDVVVAKATALVKELGGVIQETEDPDCLEELLEINDRLLGLIKKVLPAKRKKESSQPSLQGLGLLYGPRKSPPDSERVENNDKLDGFPPLNGRFLNGHANGGELLRPLLLPSSSPSSAESSTPEGGDDDDDDGDDDDDDADLLTPTSPRVDKGKQKAEPPEQPEMVLSPKTFMIAEPESTQLSYPEEGERERERREPMVSPNDRSRILVEEEGEIFRKGMALLGPEEMEGDYAGEELRRELLEAMVERPPPRPLLLTDDIGMPQEALLLDHETYPTASPKSPVVLVVAQENKPPPRPYVSSRSRSNSRLNLASPSLTTTTSPAATPRDTTTTTTNFASPSTAP